MSRMQIKRLTLVGLAKDLARQVQELGRSDDATLAAFCRFLDQDSAVLEQVSHDAVLAAGRLWELLQRELDAAGRRRRGMFFTPRPLVEFVVRSVQECLSRLDHARPLHVIDPACGYGGFLIEAQKHIAAARYSGFEIDGPTCAVAQLLTSWDGSTPLQIQRVNPLTAGETLREAILGPRNEPLKPIILGNPPWTNFGRQNRGPWIDGLLADYRTGLAERKSNLSDDAIKFIRWAQYWVEQAGSGMVAFVTPNTWLAGLTHRRMRESLLRTFDEWFVLDMHGEAGDASDENVFGIRSGVAIVLGVRLARRARTGAEFAVADVRFASLRGTRAEKLAALDGQTIQSLALTRAHRAGPAWLLVQPHGGCSRTRSAADRYTSYWPLDRIFRHYTSGVQTKNDAVFVSFTREELTAQVQAWLADQRVRLPFDPELIRPYLLAPFDRRYVYYDPRLLGRARYSVMRHMLRPNLGLVFMRQSTNPGEYDHFLAVDCLVSDRVFYSRHGAPFLAPLLLYQIGPDGEGEAREGEAPAEPLTANFSSEFFAAASSTLGNAPEPKFVFHYLYAVAHAPIFRATYAAELRRGFPRIPLPTNHDLFCELASLGRQLVALHTEPAPSAHELDVSDRQRPASAESEFRIGGYDVLKRWAKPRRTRGSLAPDERVLERLAWLGTITQSIMQHIDQVMGDALWGSPQPPPPGVSTVNTSPG